MNQQSATFQFTLVLTDAAVTAVRDIMSREKMEGQGLRVAVVGGGCSGFSYDLSFAEKPESGDAILEFEGLKVYVDGASAGRLSGVTIDYVSGLQGSGFTFQNPNAKGSCGCGHSFSG